MSENTRSRRRYVQTLAGITALGLAGCSRSSGEGTATATDETATGTRSDGSPTHTPEEDGSHHQEETGDHHEEGTDGHHEEGTDGHHEEGTDGHHEEGTDGHHEEGTDGHHSDIGEPTETAEVAMESTGDGNHFAPHIVRVTQGGTVTFTLDSGSHSSTAYHPDNDDPRLVPQGAQSWDSDVVSESGTTFEHTFETVGVYHYYCRPHRQQGMIGSVVVGDPDPESQTALETPPSSLSEAEREKIEDLNGQIAEALGGSTQ